MMRIYLRRWLLILLVGLIGASGFPAAAQENQMMPIYTNTSPRHFAWSVDSSRFVFLGSSVERSAVKLAEPDWFQYDTSTHDLSSFSVWPLQPTLTASDTQLIGPLTDNQPFIFVSPNGRFLVYTTQETQKLAIADLQLAKTYTLADLTIPNPTFGPDSFRVLWSADSNAFTVMYEPAYGEDFGTIYVHGFASNPTDVEDIYIGAFAINGHGVRGLNIQDISTDGRLILLSGIEIIPDSDGTPMTNLILWKPDDPEAAQVVSVLSGDVKGASFATNDENTLIFANERGLQTYDRMTGVIRSLKPTINTDGLRQALFSPDGKNIALIIDHPTEGNSSISIYPTSTVTG
ncbi:MAG: hypothetical protein H0X30_04365 [Anaerolineae bacterium]|nr:hypothetical protein [Anaerolineae bacterium]